MKCLKILTIVFVFVFVVVLTVGIIGNINKNTIKANAETYKVNYEAQNSIDKISTKLKSKKVFFHDKTIYANYSIIGDEKVIGIENESVGFVNLNCDFNDNEISVYADYNFSIDNHEIKIKIKTKNNDETCAELFAINEGLNIFISPISKYDAYEKYFDYAKENELLSEDAIEIRRSEIYESSVHGESYLVPASEKYFFSNVDNPSYKMNKQAEKIFDYVGQNGTSTLTNKDTYVMGTLNWIDDDGNSHPLRRVKVEIFDSDPVISVLVGATYTDNQGNFSFTFQNKDQPEDLENGGLDIFVKIFAGDDNAKVKNGLGTEDYFYRTPITQNMPTGSTKVCNYSFDMTSDLGQAFQISQALLTARDFAWAMMDEGKPSDVKVKYPYNDDTCWYRRLEKTIAIKKAIVNKTNVPNSYASWDVIMHEYGHHISYDMDIIKRTNLIEYSHSFNENLSKKYGNNVGVYLAWSEAWPTIFGMVAQDFWSRYLENIKYINDSNYDDYDFDGPYSIENIFISLGDSCEGSIVGVLWDLFDKNVESHDNISLSALEFWNVTTKNQNKTFSDFINTFYEIYPEKKEKIGSLLSFYGMAPSFLTLRDNRNDKLPYCFWLLEDEFENNQFDLIFYNSNKVELFRKSLSAMQYTLTEDDWNHILTTSSDSFYWTVQRYQDYGNGIITGPYVASMQKVVKPIPNSIFVGDSINEFIYDVDYVWYKFTAPSNGIYSFSSEGDTDTIGEIFGGYFYGLNMGTPLAADDNNGEGTNFKITYNLKYRRTVYLRIRLKNADVGIFVVKVSFDEHIHSYDKEYVFDSSNVRYHKSYCDCGEFVYEKHEFREMDSTRAYCRKCLYVGRILSNGDILSFGDELFDVLIPKKYELESKNHNS